MSVTGPQSVVRNATSRRGGLADAMDVVVEAVALLLALALVSSGTAGSVGVRRSALGSIVMTSEGGGWSCEGPASLPLIRRPIAD